MKGLNRVFTGLVLIALSLVIALNVLHIVNLWPYVGTWWPLLIISIGILSWLSNPRHIVAPLIIITVGIFLQLARLDLIGWNIFGLIWPAILFLIGVRILMPRRANSKAHSSHEKSVDSFVAFSGMEKKFEADGFTGGSVTTLFGGNVLDLRNTTIEDGAEINLFTAFGGVEIWIPENCTVQNNLLPLFGGVDDKSRNEKKAGAPTLHLTGTVLFGGVEIK